MKQQGRQRAGWKKARRPKERGHEEGKKEGGSKRLGPNPKSNRNLHVRGGRDHIGGVALRSIANAQKRLSCNSRNLRQYLYFCTSKGSKLGTSNGAFSKALDSIFFLVFSCSGGGGRASRPRRRLRKQHQCLLESYSPLSIGIDDPPEIEEGMHSKHYRRAFCETQNETHIQKVQRKVSTESLESLR